MRVQVMLTLPREAVSVPLVRHTVSAALTSAGIAPDCLDEVKVAVSEACTNALHHADQGMTYEVAINLSDEQLLIDVVDSGSGFGQRAPTAAMPAPTAESGRGLALMAALSDQAVFDSVTGDGGSVHLMKRLRWSETSVGLPLPAEEDHRPKETA